MANGEARSTGSGMITFGLVSVPVRLYPMVSEKSVSFNNIHAECGSRVNAPTVCRTCDREVSREELKKGMQVAGRTVVFEPEDLENLPLSSSKAIEIVGSIDYDELAFYRLDKSYFVGPDDRLKIGQKGFQLLYGALDESERIAIAKMARAGKESMVAIRPFGKVLALSHLYWTDELRDIEDVQATLDGNEPTDSEREMARMLLDTLPDASETVATAVDGYREAVGKVVEAKLSGTPLPEAAAPIRSSEMDMMEALRKSIEAAKAAA